ncbi:MAG: 3-deoxy-7-phosphoheptulonate synthase [Planctomycetota bacterium]|nr:MAG: 3-deoxy-7-phosphoheptulonate synthase [Planctomycetota bacterium]
MTTWAEERGARLRGFGPGWDACAELEWCDGDEEAGAAELRRDPAVEAVLTARRPCHHVAAAGREPLQVAVGPARFGGGQASAIAGPCSVEDLDSLLALARRLRKAGATALRGGAYKPRTSPYSFQGLGEPGLEILAEVSRRTGLPVVTEVLDPRDVARVAEHADVLQIGSRSMASTALLKEAGAAGRPVLLKRGMSATLSEFLFAAEYVARSGCEEILLCERGLRHFDPAVRNLLDLTAVPALKRETHLPVLVDPSHGTGDAALVPAMMAAAAAAGADGFLVEVHPRPACALSDPEQALDPAAFAAALHRAASVLVACGRRLARPEAADPAFAPS